MQLDPKLEALIDKATKEVACKSAFANIAHDLVAGAISNVLRAESLFEKRVAGNNEMRNFVGKGRDQIYATLLTSYGVSEETTKGILSFLLTP